MIRIGDKEISMAYYGSKAISAIYRGAELVWSAIQYIRAWRYNSAWKHGEPW